MEPLAGKPIETFDRMWALSDSVAEAFYPPNKPKIIVLNLCHQSDVAGLLERNYHAVSFWPLLKSRVAIHLHPDLHQISSTGPTCILNQFMV
ncbi:hypothetical protein PVL29_019708 [Vitis rotundifolia]|uniref:Uncharacterized protein n=1 Tax=Vitis rotundifolia TaxID=103349 RepID=A0AA38Z1N3_VITRO|nr:hypothetical protein PVL29_019708 [Vitis rotundifolia]